MTGRGDIRQGMQVYGADDRQIGTVAAVRGDAIEVGGRSIPTSAVAHVEGGRVYLDEAGARYLATGAQAGERREGEIAVPVAEERLRVEKREGELGAVEVRKTVEEEEQRVPVELEREEVRVERQDVGDRPVGPGDQVFEEGTIRVPVRGEEAVVSKEAVVTGEVVVEKERTTEREQIADTVRKERVEVDEHYDRHRPGFQQHFAQRQQQAGGRTWQEAEPNYQYGYMAARNNQYQGRQFEDVEPDLRSDYQQRFGGQTGQTSQSGQTGQGGTGGSDLWERLREEVREGWDRARGR